jgi:hypothetical protein
MNQKSKFSLSILWIIFYLVVIDVGINVVLPYPKDPRNITPSLLSQFFEFGRSVEGKLARMTRPTDAESAPVLAAGWLQDPPFKYYSNKQDGTTRRTISVYGMSHAVHLAEDLAKLDDSFSVRSLGAPGAVPTWSYAAFLSNMDAQLSDVTILGIMTRGVPLICTTSGLTNHFDMVWPYTYPRFSIRGGSLQRIDPPFMSIEGFRECFYNPKEWDAYVNWLNKNDKLYDPILFHKSILDKSSILRMLRRGYAYSSRAKKEAKVYDVQSGFRVEAEEIQLLRAMVQQFAEEAKKRGSLPIVYIVNNVFMGDRLFRVLEPTLRAHDIPYLSTHEICPPDDPYVYLPDSHFIPAKNMELARAMMRIIREDLDGGTALSVGKKRNLP